MEIALIILGTYVVTSVFVYSGGAFGSLEKLRNNAFMKRFGLLECFMCTSFWVALALSLVMWRLDLLLIGWGAATIADKLIQAYSVK